MSANLARAYSLSDTADVRTPPEVYDALNAVCEFDHDPCPLHGLLDSTIADGLDYSYAWGERNWVNPPFDNASPFLHRAYLEADTAGKSSLVLVPLKPHTLYWKRAVMDKATCVYMIFDRMRFCGYDRPYPLSLALVQYGDGFPVLPDCVGGLTLRRFEQTNGDQMSTDE